MKENLIRIAEKIESYMNPPKKEEGKKENDGCEKDAENAGHYGEEDEEEARDLKEELKIIANKLEGQPCVKFEVDEEAAKESQEAKAEGSEEEVDPRAKKMVTIPLIDMGHQQVMDMMMQNKEVAELIDESLWKKLRIDGHSLNVMDHDVISHLLKIHEPMKI